MGTLDIRYTIRLDGDRVEVFDVHLDEETLEIETPPPADLPDWTALEFHQCPNCPLTAEDHPRCPLAVAIVCIVRRFDNVISHDEVDVVVETRNRRIFNHTTSQAVLSSLMGLVIAASGCPNTAFFKPMARFHLPFASEAETLTRAVGTYLTAQYLRREDGQAADLELSGLDEIYETMRIVNTATAARLRAATRTDSSLNAVVRLDMYAQMAPFFIRTKLAQLRGPFAAFLGKDAGA